MADQRSEFTYIFGEKGELCLVLFQGNMSAREIPILEQCETEVKAKSHRVVIFAFRDVPSCIPGAHASFAKIQKSLRDLGKLIGVCSLRPEIKGGLLQSGVIRESEIFDNIPEAWKELREKLQNEKQLEPKDSK